MYIRMNIFYRVLTAATLLITSFVSLASDISVNDGYIREVIPGSTVTSSYMTVTNNGSQAIKLIGAKSDLIPRIEIHEHTMADGMMKMRQVSHIDIAAGKSAILQPMGLHLMMFELAKPLKQDEQVAITLVFDHNVTKEIVLPVRSIKQKKAHHHH